MDTGSLGHACTDGQGKAKVRWGDDSSHSKASTHGQGEPLDVLGDSDLTDR